MRIAYVLPPYAMAPMARGVNMVEPSPTIPEKLPALSVAAFAMNRAVTRAFANGGDDGFPASVSVRSIRVLRVDLAAVRSRTQSPVVPCKMELTLPAF